MMHAGGIGYGKVILLGEHAVVHGVTALAAALACHASARVEALPAAPSILVLTDVAGTWTVAEGSELENAFRQLLRAVGNMQAVHATGHVPFPTRAGLGSSAALGVALARAALTHAGEAHDEGRVVQVASEWERVFHGSPSGIDVAVALRGGCLAFRRGSEPEPVAMGRRLPLCIGYSGARPSTRAMVEAVGQRLAQDAGLRAHVLEGIEDLVTSAKQALARSDWTVLGKLMDDNQHLLRELDLTTASIERMCTSARAAGALGVKLTGAGGGGSVIALAPENEQHVLEAWTAEGFDGFFAEVG